MAETRFPLGWKPQIGSNVGNNNDDDDDDDDDNEEIAVATRSTSIPVGTYPKTTAYITR